MHELSIGQLPQPAGVPIDTVRYHARIGLLSPADRSASGSRRDGGAELRRLRFIRRAKALGSAREDVGALLQLSREHGVGKVRHAAQRRHADIAGRIAALERIRAGSRGLVDACPGHGRAEACPFLNASSDEATA